MVHCYTIPVLIVNFIAMLVVITGCLIGPSWTASRYKEFDMKPSEYFGCNFKRAIIVSLFIAILACISIIIYYIVLCVDIKIGGWAAGVAVFMSFLSFLFNMSYFNSMTTAMSNINAAMDDYLRMDWTFEASYQDRTYSFDHRDWGHWYTDCAVKYGQDPSQEPESVRTVNEIHNCMDYNFARGTAKWMNDGDLFYVLSFMSMGFLFFFANGKPKRTVKVFFVLAATCGLLALPIYCATLYNRTYPRICIEASGLKKTYKNLLGISWATTILLDIGTIVEVTAEHWIAQLAFIAGILLEVVNFIMIGKLTKGGMESAMREYNDLVLSGIPHYIVFALFILVVVIAVCKEICQGGCAETHYSSSSTTTREPRGHYELIGFRPVYGWVED